MKIYNTSTAPNPRRVRVFLAEKGIQVPYEEVDIVKAVNRGPEFRKKNPDGLLVKGSG
jgi:glutathione S-transferase